MVYFCQNESTMIDDNFQTLIEVASNVEFNSIDLTNIGGCCRVPSPPSSSYTHMLFYTYCH